MGYIQGMSILLLSSGLILSTIGIVLLVISYIYRNREGIIRAVGILFIGLAMLVAFQFENSVVLNAIQVFGTQPSTFQTDVQIYEIVKFNAFKGAQLGVPASVWTPYVSLIYLAQIFLMLGLIALAYVAAEALDLEQQKKIGLIGVSVLAGLGFVVLTFLSISAYTAGNTEASSTYRNIAGILKGIAVLVSIGSLAYATLSLYKELGDKPYMVQTVGLVVLLLGLTMFGLYTTSIWENIALENVRAGNIGFVTVSFLITGLLIILGAMVLLVGSILELVPTLGEEGEELALEEELEGEEGA